MEAERSLLGAMFFEEAIARRAVDHVASTDFFRAAHRLIYVAICDLLEDGKAVDLLTVRSELEQTGHLVEVGGAAYIMALVDGVPRSVNWPHYAQIVRERKHHRDIIFAAKKLTDEAYDSALDSRDVLDHGDKWLQELREGAAQEDLVVLHQAVPGFLDALDYRIAHRHELIGISTGFPSVDDLTCGLCPGELVVLAGDTGGGKSSFSLQLALTAAKAQRPVFYASLEMSRRELQYRIASTESDVLLFKIRKGWLSGAEHEAVTRASLSSATWPLYIDETTRMTIGQLRAKCRRLAAEHAIGLIVVDYVQLLTPDDRFESNRAAQVAAMSRGLKLLARELSVPIVALSQLSRDVNKKKRRPELSDLKESSGLEQDADAVWFLYREDDQTDQSELIIKKQRNGSAPETVALRFEKMLTKFYDVEVERKAALAATQQDMPLAGRAS